MANHHRAAKRYLTLRPLSLLLDCMGEAAQVIVPFMSEVDDRKRELGARLRTARENAGLTNKVHFARLIGAHESQVTSWEKGKNSPGIGYLKRYAKHTKVPLGVLTGDEEEGPEESRLEPDEAYPAFVEFLMTPEGRSLSDAELDYLRSIRGKYGRDAFPITYQLALMALRSVRRAPEAPAADPEAGSRARAKGARPIAKRRR